MNSLILFLIISVFFFLGQRYYSRILERLFDVDSSRETPARRKFDNREYIPAKHWLVLFGHHFSSIAGAGPILGPVIAGMIWGWGPALIWIVFGSILMGGVHDFSSLMVSIRHEGRSIADVAQSSLGRRARLILSGFIWLTLVLVIAVFAASAAKTLSTTPQVIVPTFGILPVATLIGLMMYRWKIPMVHSTFVGVVLLFLLIIIGYHAPVTLSFNSWLWILLIYAFVASILPVNILLQPRDYLSAFVLFFGLAFGIAGLLITRPEMHAPFYVSWSSEKGWLWPMMFITVSCGAISGFHSLVASGTTSKQLPSEADGRKVGYGGMITEGVLASIALIAVCAGLYWKGGPEGLVYPELMKGGNWIGTFGKGYGELTRPIFGVLATLIGITMLKTFIITTLDTATRIARYIGDELFGESLKLGFMHNIYINTAIVIGFALWLSLGAWQSIWPVFGAANQLLAALALIVVTTWLLSKEKTVRYTLWPSVFMLLTAIGALLWQGFTYFPQGKNLLGVMACILICLALFMVVEALKMARHHGKGEAKTDETAS
jgi:carbon starvation protein